MTAYTITFTVPGPPGRKQRPRFANRGKFVQTYTPKETQLYEAIVRQTFEVAAEAAGIDVPITDYGSIRLLVIASYPIPKSWPKWRKEAASNGVMPYTGRNDWDNLGKVVCDGLNGVAWIDDAHICYGQVQQLYGIQPRVWVRITYDPEVTRENCGRRNTEENNA